VVLLDEAHRPPRRLRGTGVGGHHQHHVAEVGLATVRVGSLAMEPLG
jgi:hypothetical protein